MVRRWGYAKGARRGREGSRHMLMQPRLRSEENVVVLGSEIPRQALTFSKGLHQHMSAAFAVAWQKRRITGLGSRCAAAQQR